MYSEEVNKFVADGTHALATKEYDNAVSSYAEACTSFNKAENRDDPHLLFLYGKALFQSGVNKSSLLGQVNQPEPEEEENQGFLESNLVDVGVSEQGDEEKPDVEEPDAEKPDTEKHESDQDEEEQPDLEAAWDILDLARNLFQKELQNEKPKPKPVSKTAPDLTYCNLLTRLSETYDLLGEVSLETENFPQAASDLELCLELRQDLYEPDSALISESHYKLSLALEFCSEPDLRAKAAEHVKAALDIVKQRKENETDDEEKKINEEMAGDLEERYEELRQEPQLAIKSEQMDIIKGLLGGVAEPKAKTSTQINDLSGMVKKRKPKSDDQKNKKARTG